jgi:hypothetical protein
MFDRAACPNEVRFLEVPFVSAAALSAVSRLLDRVRQSAGSPLDAALLSGACRTSHEFSRLNNFSRITTPLRQARTQLHLSYCHYCNHLALVQLIESAI